MLKALIVTIPICIDLDVFSLWERDEAKRNHGPTRAYIADFVLSNGSLLPKNPEVLV